MVNQTANGYKVKPKFSKLRHWHIRTIRHSNIIDLNTLKYPLIGERSTIGVVSELWSDSGSERYIHSITLRGNGSNHRGLWLDFDFSNGRISHCFLVGSTSCVGELFSHSSGYLQISVLQFM